MNKLDLSGWNDCCIFIGKLLGKCLNAKQLWKNMTSLCAILRSVQSITYVYCRKYMKYESEHCAGVFVCTVFVCHVEKRGIVAKFLWPDALPVANQQESLTGPHPFSSHSTRGRGVTPFMSALRRQYPWFTWKKELLKWCVCMFLCLSCPSTPTAKFGLKKRQWGSQLRLGMWRGSNSTLTTFKVVCSFPPSKFTKCYEVIVVECA